MTVLERITEIIGDQKIAQEVLDAGIMIPVEKFNTKLDEIKDLKEKIDGVNKTHAQVLQEKENELYEYKTSQMTEEQKNQAEIERLNGLIEQSTVKQNRAEGVARLAKAGFKDEDEISKLVETMVTADTAKSMANLDTVIGIRTKVLESAREEVEKDLLAKQQGGKGNNAEPPAKGTDEDTAFLEGLDASVERF